MAYILANDLEVGSSIYLRENGTPVEYIVVHKGIPSYQYTYSDEYGTSTYTVTYTGDCDGVYLMRKHVMAGTVNWCSASSGTYINNELDTKLHGLLSTFDATAKRAIKVVGRPLHNARGESYGYYYSRVFPLNAYELGQNLITTSLYHPDMGNYTANCPPAGALFDYFNSTSAATRRKATDSSGTARQYWTGSHSPGHRSGGVYTVTTSGALTVSSRSYDQNTQTYTTKYYARPALAISRVSLIDTDTMELHGLEFDYEQRILMPGYTSIRALKSSGTQYIDTGATLEYNYKVELKFSYYEAPSSKYGLFGFEGNRSMPMDTTTGANVATSDFSTHLGTNQYITSDYGNKSTQGSAALSPGQSYVLVQNGATTTIGGQTISNSGATSWSTVYGPLSRNGSYAVPAYLFAVKKYDYSAQTTQVIDYASIAVDYFAVYMGDGTLLKCFFPAITADGECGMYEAMNNVFHGNKGTGKFTFVKEPQISKVVTKSGQVLIDLTNTNVTGEGLLEGFTAIDKTGNIVLGEASAGSPSASGTYTATANVNTFTISGLGFKPTAVIVQAESYTINSYLTLHKDTIAGKKFVSTVGGNNWNMTITGSTTTTYEPITINNDGFMAGSTSAGYSFLSSYKYKWYAIG